MIDATTCANRHYAFGPFLELLGCIPTSETRILDIGCGAGDNGRVLQGLGKEVHGVTLSAVEAESVSRWMKRVTVADIETWSPAYQVGTFDGILLSHVLEHLKDPWKTLADLKPLVRDEGHVYVGLPNISYWKLRLGFLAGRFEYTEDGPMDRTHLRFFNYFTGKELISRAGLKLVLAQGVGHFPLGFLRKVLGPVAQRLDTYALKRWPNLFAHSLIFVGRT